MNMKFFTYGVLFLSMILLGCNDTSTDSNNADANTAGSVSDQETGSQYRGPLGTVIDQADAAVHGKVVSFDEIHSDDALGVPHTVVNVEIIEKIMGDIEDYGTGVVSFRFVRGTFADGRTVDASNNPNVAVGDEVVALITEHTNPPCTLTQCAKGLFIVKGNTVIADNGSAVVVDDNHKVSFVTKVAQAKGLKQDLLAKGSVANFKSHLASLAKSSSAAAKSKRATISKLDITQPFTASPALTRGIVGPSTNVEQVEKDAKRKAERAKYIATLSAQDQWELKAFEENNGNPVLSGSYMGDGQH